MSVTWLTYELVVSADLIVVDIFCEFIEHPIILKTACYWKSMLNTC